MRVLSSILVAALAEDPTKGNSPVEKVIQLIEGLQGKVNEEGQTEAATYETFACFCRDESDARSAAITENSNNVDTYNGDLEGFKSDQNDQETNIKDLQDNLAELKANKTQNHEEFLQTKQVFETHLADFNTALKQLRKAIDAIQASRPATVLSQADQELVESFLQKARALDLPVPRQDYTFKSDDIIGTLKKLQDNFIAEKDDLEHTFLDDKDDHDMTQQDYHQLIVNDKKSLNDEMALLAETNGKIGETQNLMTQTYATLRDDHTYLKELTAKCEAKKALWDQRWQARQGELHALTEAISIIKGTVTNKDVSRKMTAPALVQVSSRSTQLMKELLEKSEAAIRALSPEQQAADILLHASKTLHSHELAAMAMHVQADPMARVKGLIQELIERLLAEQGDEANHKAWCDEQLTNVKQKRDQQHTKVRRQSASLQSNEGVRDKLKETLDELRAEELATDKAKQEAEDQRQKEKDNNNEAIKDAEEGRKAVEKAIDVLRTYYTSAAEKAASLAQEDPDAGFDEKYGGDQDTAGGIFGMLEVISSDFSRAIKETSELEMTQHNEWTELNRAQVSTLAEKREAIAQFTSELKTVTDNIHSTFTSFTADVGLMNTQIMEYQRLVPACVNRGVPYEERKEKREDEIRALKDALQILSEADV
jgi:hypothetical protein